jgi:hypothetical protein
MDWSNFRTDAQEFLTAAQTLGELLSPATQARS